LDTKKTRKAWSNWCPCLPVIAAISNRRRSWPQSTDFVFTHKVDEHRRTHGRLTRNRPNSRPATKQLFAHFEKCRVENPSVIARLFAEEFPLPVLAGIRQARSIAVMAGCGPVQIICRNDFCVCMWNANTIGYIAAIPTKAPTCRVRGTMPGITAENSCYRRADIRFGSRDFTRACRQQYFRSRGRQF
jgi:hypothetical protein